MNIVLAIALLAGVPLLAVLALAWLSGRAVSDRIDDLRVQMLAGQQVPASPRGDIPEVIRRYAIRAGGSSSGPGIFHARHRATLATARDQATLPMEADQWTGTRVPGFVWAARGDMMGLPVRIVDSYVGGEGLLDARVFGVFRVAGGTGPDYAKGELLRYLSELPVYPDAILNARGLTWRQPDERTVEVSARSAYGNASLRFLLASNGDISAMQADDRPMAVGGGSVPTPWHGTYSEYKQFGSYRIPSHSEIGWVLADGLFTYWKGEIVAYEPAPMPAGKE